MKMTATEPNIVKVFLSKIESPECGFLITLIHLQNLAGSLTRESTEAALLG